jgi:hypothetical protein
MTSKVKPPSHPRGGIVPLDHEAFGLRVHLDFVKQLRLLQETRWDPDAQRVADPESTSAGHDVSIFQVRQFRDRRRRSASELFLGRLFHLGESAREDLAPAPLSGEPCFDPAQGLRDRVVLPIRALEAVIDRIEMPEHLLSKLGEAEVYLVEPAVHVAESTVNLGELAPQEFDELLVLDGGHGPYPSQVQTVCKRVQM